jgi:hypothetical protein
MKKVLILLSCFAFLIALSRNIMATVVNGGFETGDLTGWDMWVSGVYPVEFSITTDAHSDLYAAKGSMDQSCENGWIEQTFIVPQEGIFSFYYKSNMQGGIDISYDGYRILSGWSLFDITTEAQITSAYFNYTIDYTPTSYDLSAYAGHWVRFRVYVGSDGSCGIPIDPPHEVHVDDVRVVNIEGILDDIENLVDSGVLNQGQGDSLIVKLIAAERAMDENPKAACNQLQAFIREVQGYVKAGILSAAQGQSLIYAANSLISQLCGE